MRVDLSICEHLGLANTAMLRVYAAVNPNFRLLCLFVKHWSQRRRVNDVSQHMLSSYAWSLLVLFVLQTAEPRALPVLQGAALCANLPRKTVERADGATFDCTFWSNAQAALSSIGYSPESQLGLGDLLLRFFALYASIGHDRFVVSVRTGVLQPRGGAELHPELPSHASDGFACIEDPFEITRDLADALTDETRAITRAELNRAHALLRDGGGHRPWAHVLGELLLPRI